MGQFRKYKFKSQDGNYELEAISGWLPIKQKRVTKQHWMFDYGDKGTELTSKSGKKKTREVCYFSWGHSDYPLGLVIQLTYPMFFENEDGKTSYICGFVGISNSMGFSVEMDDSCEAVRLFTERRIDHGRDTA